MTEAAGASAAALARPVRRVTTDAPWLWLEKGWNDFRRAPATGLAYGLVFTLASFAITLGLYALDLAVLILPLAAGFALVAPFLAVGVYETSRRLESGEPVGFAATALAWRRAPGGLLMAGVMVMLFFLAWVRLATLLFALFYGVETPGLSALMGDMLFTPRGLAFLAVGSAIGAVLALVVFAISAVAFPFILDRDVFVLAAIATSAVAVVRNPAPMLLWAFLIALFIAAGIVTAFLGLLIFFPLLGHATWHAYRDLVADAARG